MFFLHYQAISTILIVNNFRPLESYFGRRIFPFGHPCKYIKLAAFTIFLLFYTKKWGISHRSPPPHNSFAAYLSTHQKINIFFLTGNRTQPPLMMGSPLSVKTLFCSAGSGKRRCALFGTAFVSLQVPIDRILSYFNNAGKPWARYLLF